jgi:hypothetical protein
MWAVVIVAAMAMGTSIVAQKKNVKRSLAEFLAAQGSTSDFFSPCPDEFGWGNNPFTKAAWFDYAGKSAECHHLDLGTMVTGTVTERPMADGRALVQVNLHTTNALTWAAESFDANAPTWFGYRPDLIKLGNTPALGECHFQVVFYNPEMGYDLPDILALWLNPTPPVGQELVSLYFRGTATGPLHPAFGVPEGTPGNLYVSQIGFLNKKNGNPFPSGDGWPDETVELMRAP